MLLLVSRVYVLVLVSRGVRDCVCLCTCVIVFACVFVCVVSCDA